MRLINSFIRDPYGLRKLVGVSAAIGAFGVVIFNILTLARLGRASIVSIIIDTEINVLFISGLVALASAAWNSRMALRLQVAFLFLTALLSAMTAKGGDLTSALPLILGLILALEYNFGRRSLLASAAVAFIVYPLALGWGYSHYSAAYLSQAAAAIIGLFFFIALFGGIILRHRVQHREEAERLESRVKERTRELEELLEERAAMLREIHHRVKNNLQLIASLLRLESDRIEDASQRRPFCAGIERVDAIAMAHDSLYVADRLDLVDLGVYASRLIQSVSQDSLPQVGFDVSITGEPRIRLDHAVSFGILLHELVANVRDHAYPGQPGRGRIELKGLSGFIELRVSDEGVGMPVEPRPDAGIGLPLAKALAEQLDGTLTRSDGAPHGAGTAWLLRFSTE
jgi:two-component sensor histidine kinase